VTRSARPGFALAAALVVVVAVALIVALMVESAGARAGMAAAELDSVRANGDAEGALAAALALVVDTAALRAPPGDVVARVGAAGGP
jgi:Tfp pilus assembly protein PilX